MAGEAGRDDLAWVGRGRPVPQARHAGWQPVEDGLPPRIVGLGPQRDLVTGPAAADAPTRGAIEPADVDARTGHPRRLGMVGGIAAQRADASGADPHVEERRHRAVPAVVGRVVDRVGTPPRVMAAVIMPRPPHVSG